MKVLRALVIANRKKPVAAAIKKEAELFLRSRGVALSPSSPQLVITVGGDGTVLFSKRHYGKPFFAIGSQTSFICQAHFGNWRQKLSRALSSLRTEKRLLLSCTLNGRRLPLSLNEIGIRNPEPRVLSLHLAVGRGGSSGRKHFAFRADGIFFSTPTGSPAYCYSCGGKEMKRNEWRYQAVAISPFRRLFKPLFLPAGSSCTLRLSSPDTAQLFVDGQVIGRMTSRDTLKVAAGKKAFFFARA